MMRKHGPRGLLAAMLLLAATTCGLAPKVSAQENRSPTPAAAETPDIGSATPATSPEVPTGSAPDEQLSPLRLAIRKGLVETDEFFGDLVEWLDPKVMWEIPLGGERKIPALIVIILLGGIYLTCHYKFINLTFLRHSIEAIRGKYDDPDEVGEISHYKALTSALAATVGLGNIAGVAVAITLGGPGAIFWMWVMAFFGMCMQFASCVLAQSYRWVLPDGHVIGGPMVYLRDGTRDLLLPFRAVGTVFSYMYAIIIVFAAFAAGNMFQGNQTHSAMVYVFERSDTPLFKLITGLVLAFLVGIVIIGGIKRIGEVTSKLVPFMCIFYILVCSVIVFANLHNVPELLAGIVIQAFRPEAASGGMIGVLVQGMRRAAFSNEAGLGSASIAQAAAKTSEPVRAAAVAMLGPVIDTMIVCTMTALAILITETHFEGEGVQITAAAFSTVWVHMPKLLAIAVFIFAYSTMISWSYYGERSVEFLLGQRGIMPYRVAYVLVVILGPILSLTNVINFADIVFLSLAVPNILGMIILSGKVRSMMEDYVRRLRAGEMVRVR